MKWGVITCDIGIIGVIIFAIIRRISESYPRNRNVLISNIEIFNSAFVLFIHTVKLWARCGVSSDYFTNNRIIYKFAVLKHLKYLDIIE